MLTLYIGAAILTVPWWGTVLFRFGMSPFVMAGQVAKMDSNQIIGKFLGGRMLDVHVTFLQDFYIPSLAIIGILVSLYKKDFFLPFWLMAVFVVAPKNSPIPGVIPLILLSAIGLRSVDNLLLIGLRFLKGGRSIFDRLFTTLMQMFSFLPPSSIYIFIVIPLSLINLIKQPILHPIKQNERAAMQFIANNTSQNAKFIVLTPLNWFEADSVEWFPLLANRQSLTTPQGLEWISSSEFLKVGQITRELSSLVRLAQTGNDSGKIVSYVETHFEEFEYIAIFANNLEKNFGGFLETGRFDLVYSRKNVLIFIRTSTQINK